MNILHLLAGKGTTALYSFMAAGGGLKTPLDYFKNNWIAPLFIFAVAVAGIYFIFKREFRALFSFLAIAVVAGILIFYGDAIFGKNGNLTKVGADNAKAINAIISDPSFSLGQLKMLLSTIHLF